MVVAKSPDVERCLAAVGETKGGSLATVAAIPVHCIAGGTLLALGTFAVLTLARLAIVYVFAHCLSRTNASQAVDSVDFLNSIIFSAQLTPTWQLAAQLFETSFSGNVWGTLGGVMKNGEVVGVWRVDELLYTRFVAVRVDDHLQRRWVVRAARLRAE